MDWILDPETITTRNARAPDAIVNVLSSIRHSQDYDTRWTSDIPGLLVGSVSRQNG